MFCIFTGRVKDCQLLISSSIPEYVSTPLIDFVECWNETPEQNMTLSTTASRKQKSNYLFFLFLKQVYMQKR